MKKPVQDQALTPVDQLAREPSELDPGRHDEERAAASARARAVILTVGLFISFAYFYQAGGWNQNSRMGLVWAITRDGTLQIDKYHRSTNDKSVRDGHYYSDKAPGLAFAAVPFVAAVPGGDVVETYVATVATSAVPTALAALLLFHLALRFGASVNGAGFAAVTFGLGTPTFAYATLFFGHAMASACLVAAFASAYALRTPGSLRRDLLLGGAVGLAGGWATVTEFPSMPPAALITGLALLHARPGGLRRVLTVAGGIAVAASLCVMVLAAYNYAAFGSVFEIGYAHLEGFPGHKEGYQGLTYPKWDALSEILFGRFRGLLLLAPVLALAPVGFAHLIRDRRDRDGASRPAPTRFAAITAIVIVVYYILFNASFIYWPAGWTYGPRYLASALPFLCLALATLWTAAGKPAMRVLLGALAVYGIALSLIAVSTTPQPPLAFTDPVADLLVPAFIDGDLSLNHQSFTEPVAEPHKLRGGLLPHAAWNIGEKLGLRGHASLLPLAAVWLAMAAGWWWSALKSGRRARQRS